MGVTVRWTDSALDDLDEALGFIADDNPTAAGNLGRKVKRLVRTLKTYPLKGRVVPEYEDPTIRELIVAPFRIIYTTKVPGSVYIVATIRAERLLDPASLQTQR